MKIGINRYKIDDIRVEECTRETFYQVLNSKKVHDICLKINQLYQAYESGQLEVDERTFRDLVQAEKKKAPYFCYSAFFRNGLRSNASAIPLDLVIYDIDHMTEDPRQYFEEHIRPRLKELGIVLAHVSISGHGLRLVFIMPQGMNSPEEAQRWMAAQLDDDNYDDRCKDWARASYAFPIGYLLYIDEEELFADRTPLMFRDGKKKAAVNEERRMKTIPMIKQSKNVLSEANEELPCGIPEKSSFINRDNSMTMTAFPTTYEGVPYAEIVDEWVRLDGGEPQIGRRNDTLHRLAYDLRHLCDNNPQMMSALIPNFGLADEEKAGLIKSACKAEWSHKSRLMVQAIKNVKARHAQTAPKAGKVEAASSHAAFFNVPFPIDNLPPLIRHLVSCTPDIYKPAVSQAVFPSLAAHLKGVRFRYVDNVEHEATLMCVLVAETGAGKSCIDIPIDYILADIRVSDEANRRREAQWKEANAAKGANKARTPRPKDIAIRIVSPDMSNAALVLRLGDSDGYFLYARMNEIEAFDALRGSSRNPQQFVIMRLAFDTGEYGQERVGDNSVSERVRVRFNWNASTTPARLQQYFARVLTDGPVSRINFCTLPQQEIGAEMPVYGTYDDDFDRQLRPYIDNLCQASGLILCPQLDELARKLHQELSDEAVLTQDRVYDNLARRALVIGWLKACVLYVAQGCQWDDAMEEFIRWSVHYDLWCKLHFFGKAIEQLELDENATRRPGPRNLLKSLPDTFTRADLLQLRLKRGMKEKGTHDLLYQWQKRGFIRQTTDDNYEKLKYFTGTQHGTDTDPHAEA